ncbi:MAG: Ig-like domain-containing protein, partial [Acidobacteria bacterium]|nr:Ig-like domain-containing protein [Acidobacteriota bacterium]
NTAVAWSVQEASGGAVDGSGLYTAPATPGTYHVKATSAADTSKSATVAVTVTAAPPVVAVSINPEALSVQPGKTQQFTATVTGSTNTAVAWSVQEASGGAVDGSGLYTAPATPGTYHVKATSAADTSKSATADVYRWLDSNQKQRTAVLTRNDASDPGGSHGGMLRQYRYFPGGGSAERVVTGTGASGLWNGWGYLVNHYSPGDSSEQSLGHAGQYRLAFTGRHHALHEFTWTYPILGVSIKATVHWFMATGQDHPVYAVTYDTSAAGPSGFDASHLIDSRSPYGDLQFGGDGSNPNVDGVGWGDHYKFFTRDEPFTAQSRWDYSQPNTVPYVIEYIKNPDAEMGSVQTQSWLQHNTGGTWFTNNWGLTSDNPAGEFGAWRMPANWNWPYQLNQYELGDSGPTTSKRLAWGLMYGAVGQLSTFGYGYQTTIVGHPYQSYSVHMVLGRHSDSTVAGQTIQVERKLGATLTASQGTVITQGPGGVGRTDPVAYDKPGYNPIYGAFELAADATGAFQATLNAAAGDIKNPLFIVRGMGALPTQITLGGRTLVADQDYFASYETTTHRLWLTLNLNWSGSQSLGSNATGAPSPDIQTP